MLDEYTATSRVSAHADDRSSAQRTTEALPELIHLLQGAPEPCIADVGIARLDATRLNDMHALATRQAEASIECAELVLALIADFIDDLDTAATWQVTRAFSQIQRALVEFRRWRDLADNAAYFRDHPAVHAGIALSLD